MSKQSIRRKIAKLRADVQRTGPWAIDVRTLGMIEAGIEQGDIDAIRSAMSFGGDVESAVKIHDGVAVIPVTGVLRDQVDFMVRYFGASCYSLIERDFQSALNNESVKGILFYFDSPGGSAIGCKRVADRIFDARGEKPIRSYVQGVCGSAAFYIASATDRIEATADSMVASVGTIYPHSECSKMCDEMGVKYTVFTNADSPKKGHGNLYEPLSDESKATLQKFVDDYGRPFVEDVARYRGITPDDVIAKYGQGDSMRADVAVKSNVIDAIVEGFVESLESFSGAATPEKPSSPVVVTGQSHRSGKMDNKIKAQLFALGLIDSMDASDAECKAALRGWYGGDAPEDTSQILASLRKGKVQNMDDPEEGDEDEAEDGDDDEEKPESKLQQAHRREQGEARIADLRAAADLVNKTAGRDGVTADMVLGAFEKGLDAKGAMAEWAKKLEAESPVVAGVRVKGEGSDRYATDIVDALVYRASSDSSMQLSDNAAALANRPLWAVAAECLQMAGQPVDMYGNRELICEQAMAMGNSAHQRHTFFSENEGRQYIQAAGVPYSRPGDFPNILSNLANKFLDAIELDDDYSYPEVSAVLPGGMNDFKPAMMVNKGIVEELDELSDAEEFKQLGLSEEVLSYIFLRRFGNKWGWTPVMLANDDLGAFVEGMIGLEEAWQVTQNRLVVDQYSSNPTLLDGTALFADRADVGSATNNNLRSNGNPPSDTEWEAMEVLYADIGGIGTGRRVRGNLNVVFGPTGDVRQEALRTFAPLNVVGETKQAATTANLGLYRGQVKIITESELRASSALVWYGLRNPTRLNTATVVRAYFNGFGTAGRRERWYEPTNKTTWVSIEGRIAVAVKNWRYAVRNAGTGA